MPIVNSLPDDNGKGRHDLLNQEEAALKGKDEGMKTEGIVLGVMGGGHSVRRRLG